MSRTKKVQEESPSQKLRGIFYRLFEKNNEDFEHFEDYYDSKMFKLINYYKKLI